MRVVIGYDGSDCSDSAVDGLVRAGLPQNSEVLVVTVADVWPGSLDAGVETLDEAELAKLHGVGEGDAERLPAVLQRAYSQAHRNLLAARGTAAQGAARLQALVSDWKIEWEGVADPPGWGVIRKAAAWKADLIVIGSHGRSALGRLLLGSVSHFVLHHSPLSVRVSRSPAVLPQGGARLVLGIDGSADSEAAILEVASRNWPAGTEVLVMAALDPRLLTMPLMAGYPAWGYVAGHEEDERTFYERMVNDAAEKLKARGLAATSVVREGDPKWVLVDEAERWGADCVFLGAKGHGALDRILIGSVSMAVATRAHCSVEIVRPK